MIKKNIISNLIMQIVAIVYGFIIPIIIIKQFGSNTNGLVSSITQFLGYITLLESGVGPIIKASLYKPLIENDKRKIEGTLRSSEKFFKKLSYIFIVYVIILCIIFPTLLKENFDFIYCASLILIISISTFAEYCFGITYRIFLQADQKNYIVSIIHTITYIICIVVVAILSKIGASIQIIKLSSVIVFIMRPIIQNYYVKKKYNLNLKYPQEEIAIKQKWDGLSHHISYVIHNNTDITILTIFSNIGEVSVYSVYYLVIKGIKSIVLSLLSSIDASFGKLIAAKNNTVLKEKFNNYEKKYLFVVTIIYSCTIVLITPFVKVYTIGINDMNYSRVLFGYLLVLSEYIWAIRQPYYELVKASCKFKETSIGGWIEAILNIVLSVAFVYKFGLVGVAIGTLISIFIRTIEIIIFSNKNILNISALSGTHRLFLSIAGLLLTLYISNKILSFKLMSYIDWFKVAIFEVMIALIINLLIYQLISLINKRRSK